MVNGFRAETFQNEYLPAGASEVHAIVSVSSDAGTRAGAPGEHVFGVMCDVSGSMEGAKLAAAKDALRKMVSVLPERCFFFVVAGADGAQLVCPLARADAPARQRAMAAIDGMRAFGGTRMSNWLQVALEQFRMCPGALRQALLLTDGQNDEGDKPLLAEAVRRSEGVFQCDCRGVGTDWQVEQLRAVATGLLGSVDIIATPAQMEADFRGILARALAKTVSDVTLRLWTPLGARVRFCKQVSPTVVDLTGRARERGPQLREYPTGAWGAEESRDYHLCVEVRPGAVGDEMLAGRVSLLHTLGGVEEKVAESRILAVWTGDEARSTRIHRVVAHYTGQTELAASIQEGMEARARGDVQQATVLLGKAVRIATASGNEATTRLLGSVVEVEDAARGTVRLRNGVAAEDAMALEARSTRTTRLTRA